MEKTDTEILIVSQDFWPENFRINALAVGLKEKGHQVTVLTGLGRYLEFIKERFEIEEFVVRCLNILKDRGIL